MVFATTCHYTLGYANEPFATVVTHFKLFPCRLEQLCNTWSPNVHPERAVCTPHHQEEQTRQNWHQAWSMGANFGQVSILEFSPTLFDFITRGQTQAVCDMNQTDKYYLQILLCSDLSPLSSLVFVLASGAHTVVKEEQPNQGGVWDEWGMSLTVGSCLHRIVVLFTENWCLMTVYWLQGPSGVVQV